jgi:MFS family permease
MALGINQISALSGQFIGLVAGGLLSAWDWRAVFWVNLPVGLLGTVWAYRSLRETSARTKSRIDWWGNLTFAAGLGALLVSITYGIQPYAGHTMGWTSPKVLAGLVGGAALLVAFCVVESRVAQPMFHLSLVRTRAFAAGNAASLLAAVARGGRQCMLIIWLQGLWLPLHGYDYADTPLWAGIFLLPMTAGFLLAGPLCGWLSDRYGARFFTTGGLVLFSGSFVGLLALPITFPYWAFALLIMANGMGSGMFSAPNTSAIMSSVPVTHRGAASGMRSTFQNSGMSLSIGIFFSLMIVGLADRMPSALSAGLQAQGVPPATAAHAAALPPVSTVFSAFLGINPVRTVLGPDALGALPAHSQAVLTGKEFFPHLISGPFHHGLLIVFATAAGMGLLAATASLLRGRPGAN